MRQFSYIFRYGIIVALVFVISIAYVDRQHLFPKFFADDPSAGLTQDANRHSEARDSVVASHSGKIPEYDSTTDKGDMTQSGGISGSTDAVSGLKNDMPVLNNETSDILAGTKSEKKQGLLVIPAPGLVQDPSPEANVSQKPLISEPVGGGENAQLEAPATIAENNEVRGIPKEIIPQDRPDAATTVLYSDSTQEQQYLQIINTARQAFWQGLHKNAVTRYEQAILHLPGQADAYGELGNVYYAMGEWSLSGEYLYLAALRLMESGELERARYLSTVIKGLKPERAKELEKKLAEEK